jgi:peroxiredoxin
LLEEIQSLGAHLIAVSPQVPQGSQVTAEKNGLTFRLLSDADNHVARQFGIVFKLTQEVRDVYLGLGIDLAKSNGNPHWELPLPATYVIDRDRAIRDVFVDADYVRRMEPADILAALRSLSAFSPRRRGDHREEHVP